jgi:hypothetical protein
MSTIARRITAVVTAGLLTAALVTTPAPALRLVPTDPSGDRPIVHASEDPSLLMTTGRLAAYLSKAAARPVG